MKTTPFDAAEYLDTVEAQEEFLKEAFDSGDHKYIARALGIVARAKGMTQVSKEAGVNRESLYRALSEDGDPRLSTLLGVMKALGVSIDVKHVA